MSDELSVEYRSATFTGHCEVELKGSLTLGFIIGNTVRVLPGGVTELRLVLTEVDALSLSRAVMDVLQGLAHDRIIAMREANDV